jgi:hypothetical protein
MVATVAISVCGSRQKFVDLGRAALSAKKVRQLRHDDASPTQKRYDSPKRHNCVIISLWRWKHSQQQPVRFVASAGPCRPSL